MLRWRMPTGMPGLRRLRLPRRGPSSPYFAERGPLLGGHRCTKASHWWSRRLARLMDPPFLRVWVATAPHRPSVIQRRRAVQLPRWGAGPSPPGIPGMYQGVPGSVRTRAGHLRPGAPLPTGAQRSPQLVHLLRTTINDQMPSHFAIYPLPEDIICWVTSLGRQSTVKKDFLERQEANKLGSGCTFPSSEIPLSR